jgi:hypothetical protein
VQVLFDQGTPAPLRRFLPGHSVQTAHERGWSTLENGALLLAAEAAGFEVFVTTDTKLKYQQNLAVRKIALVVLSTPSWPRIQAAVDLVVHAVDQATPAGYVDVAVPSHA